MVLHFDGKKWIFDIKVPQNGDIKETLRRLHLLRYSLLAILNKKLCSFGPVERSYEIDQTDRITNEKTFIASNAQ